MHMILSDFIYTYGMWQFLRLKDGEFQSQILGSVVSH